MKVFFSFNGIVQKMDFGDLVHFSNGQFCIFFVKVEMSLNQFSRIPRQNPIAPTFYVVSFENRLKKF